MMMMMFERWKPKKRIEYNYKMALFDLIERFNKTYNISKITDPYELLSFFREYCAQDFFMPWAYAAASMMVTGLKVDGAKTWRQAATKSMNGKKIYWMLQQEMMGSVGVKVKQLIGRNALLIGSFPERVARETTAYINSQYQAGRRSEFIVEDLKGRFPKMAKSRLELISRTEVSKASTALTRARSEEIGSGWFVWRTSKDARVRQSHRDMDRVLVNWNDLPSPEKLAGEKHTYGNYAPGDIFNCFTGSTKVSLSNGYNCIWKRNYRGKIGRVTMSNGATFEATINHPILTEKGWVPLNSLQNGDNLIHANRNQLSIGNNDIDESVATFSDVFETFRSLLGSYTTSGSKFDFHGDGTDDNIEIVCTTPFLSGDGISSGLKSICDLSFAKSDSSVIDLGIVRRERNIGETLFSGLFNELSFGFNVQLPHSDEISIRNIPVRDIISSEYFGNSESIAPIFFRQGQFTKAPNVIKNNVAFRNVCSAIMSGMSTFGNFKTTSAKMLGNSIGGMINGSGSLDKSFPITYEKLSIVDIDFRNFHDHVFGLQSLNGWYTIAIAQKNIIVKNCRCYPQPVIDLNLIKFPSKIYHNGSISMITRAKFEKLNKAYSMAA